MFWLLVQKELKNIINSPKFIVTFATVGLLMLLSVAIGINEYHNSVRVYESASMLEKEDYNSARGWSSIVATPHRVPDPLQIFSSGTNFDVGRYSNVSKYTEVSLSHSPYSDDPVFAVFRHIDFTFIVTIVLSLFAILFTYNNINGEREDGTLKLVFTNSVKRSTYILAKITGSWLGIIVPVLISMLISLLIVGVTISGVTTGDWIRIISLAGISILYLTFFVVFGTLVSSFTRTSASSFLVLLVCWIAMVFVVPRIGVMVAGQLVQVPTEAEIESIKDSYQSAAWEKHFDRTRELAEKRRTEMEGMSDEEREVYEDENSWNWMEENDRLSKEMEADVAEYGKKLNEDYYNKKNVMYDLAFSLTRFSPASAFNLAAMRLAGTDVHMKQRYEESIRNYKNGFLSFVDKKEAEDGDSGHGGISFSMDSEKGMTISDGRKDRKIDISEIPLFVAPKNNFTSIANDLIIDVSIIIIMSFLCFSASFYAFQRYDLR